ncbi:MAG: hypothetical protein IH840_04375, partial [Candidatus Heimdallarchaeota archaeon]|nr:hypothetical protein [Candidatus Heimdallarchaeota archaeon]
MANLVSTKIQRQYISKGFEAFYYKDLSSKDEILKRMLKIINADDGIKGVIFVGLNKNHKPSLAQDYNLKLYKKEVFTLLSQIHPLPNYKAILQFVPSLYAKYGIIEITPKLARFFFKHEVVQKSLFKFEDAENMKIRKIIRAGDLNHEISYEQALEHVSFHILDMRNLDDFHRLLSFLLHPTELGYIRDPIDMLAPIVNRVNLDDHNSVRETVANVKHLFLFFRKTK